MSSELTFTPQVLLSIEPANRDHSAKIAQDDHIAGDTDRAIEASRRKFVEDIAKAEGMEQGRLVIERDNESGRFVHKLLDPQSGEVVRQWPEESWLEFAKAHHAPKGLWVNQSV